MPDDELQKPFHRLDPADAAPDPPWPQLSLDEPLDTDLSDSELAPLELPPEFWPAPDLLAEDDQEWVRGLDAAAFSQAASLEDGPLEDTSLALAMTIRAEPIGERADPVPSSPLEDLSRGSVTTPLWSDEPGEPVDPVLVTSASPARPFRREAGRTGEGRWRPPHQRGTFQTIALVALAALAASGMYLADRRGDHSALDFTSSKPGPVIAAQGVRPPTASLRGPNTGPLGAGAAVTEPGESGAPGIGVAPRSGVLGPIPASRPAGTFAVGASPSSGPGSPTRPPNPAVPAVLAASAAAQTPAPASSPPPFEAGAPRTSPPATESVERATSPAAQLPPAPPAAAAPLDIAPVDTYVPDVGPPPTSPPAPPAPTSPPATAPPATSPPLTSPPPPTFPATTSPPATAPPVTSPPVTEPPATTPVTNGGGKTPPGQDNSGKRGPDGKPGAPG